MSVIPPVCPNCFTKTWGNPFFERPLSEADKRVHVVRYECVCCNRKAFLMYISNEQHQVRGLFACHKTPGVYTSRKDESSLRDDLLNERAPNLHQNASFELFTYTINKGNGRWDEVLVDPVHISAERRSEVAAASV